MRVGHYEIPENLLYTEEHLWTRKCKCLDCGEMLVGITGYSSESLKEIMEVALPKEGDSVKQLAAFATLKSNGSVSKFCSPLSGTVTRVNSDLASNPALIIESPYEKGWLLRMEPSDLAGETKSLLNARQYSAVIASSAR